MMRGVGSLAQQRARQQRGGLATLARVGGEAMTAPARAGFRARFEREARELAARGGRTLSARQLEESADALLRAHMSRMAEARLKKAAQKKAGKPADELLGRSGDIDELMADAQRKALGDAPEVRAEIQRVAQPIRLCVGCWVELCAGQAFPAEASSMLCARHLAAYTNQNAGDSSDSIQEQAAGKPRPTRKGDQPSEKSSTKKTTGARVAPRTPSRPQSGSSYTHPFALEQL